LHDTENESSLNLSPDSNVEEREKSMMNVSETNLFESEKENKQINIKKQDENYDEKKRCLSAHTKPKQYNLGDYF
jgi:hypothetical protein